MFGIFHGYEKAFKGRHTPPAIESFLATFGVYDAAPKAFPGPGKGETH